MRSLCAGRPFARLSWRVVAPSLLRRAGRRAVFARLLTCLQLVKELSVALREVVAAHSCGFLYCHSSIALSNGARLHCEVATSDPSSFGL